MNKRIESYLRAIEDGTVPQYHDYIDVHEGRMPVEEYIRKYGKYTGCRSRLKHVR